MKRFWRTLRDLSPGAGGSGWDDAVWGWFGEPIIEATAEAQDGERGHYVFALQRQAGGAKHPRSRAGGEN